MTHVGYPRARQLQQRVPAETFGDGRWFVERRLRLLVRHFQEQQKRQLLHVIAIRQTIIAENVAIIPKFLDKGRGIAHEKWTVKNASLRDVSSQLG